MKKLLILLIGLLSLLSCNVESAIKDAVEDANNIQQGNYIGDWENSFLAFNEKYSFTATEFELSIVITGSNPLNVSFKGSLVEKDADTVTLNATQVNKGSGYEDITASTDLTGIAMYRHENKDIDWSRSGSFLDLTVNGTETTYTLID